MFYISTVRKSHSTLYCVCLLTPFFPPHRKDFIIADFFDHHDTAGEDDQGKNNVEDDFPCRQGGSHDSVCKALVSGKADEIINRMQDNAGKSRTRNDKQCTIEEAVQSGYKRLDKGVGYGGAAFDIYQMHNSEYQSGDSGQKPDLLFRFEESHRNRNYSHTKYAFFPESGGQRLYDIEQGWIEPEVVRNQLYDQHCNTLNLR